MLLSITLLCLLFTIALKKPFLFVGFLYKIGPETIIKSTSFVWPYKVVYLDIQRFGHMIESYQLKYIE